MKGRQPSHHNPNGRNTYFVVGVSFAHGLAVVVVQWSEQQLTELEDLGSKRTDVFAPNFYLMSYFHHFISYFPSSTACSSIKLILLSLVTYISVHYSSLLATKHTTESGEQQSTMVSLLVTGPNCTWFDSEHPQKIFREKHY